MLKILVDISGKWNAFDGRSDQTQTKKFRVVYREILKEKELTSPASTQADRVHKWEIIESSNARKRLDLLINFEGDVLRFIEEEVPFTNKLGERDLHMIKAHQQISMRFQSELGAEIFCQIRGYLSSCRKQGVGSS